MNPPIKLQPGLFDPRPTVLDRAAARAARDEAIERVDRAAHEDWKREASAVVDRLILRGGFFSSDDVWATGLRKPREPRALGAILQRAVRAGRIEQAGFVRSAQKLRHHAPIAVWRVL